MLCLSLIALLTAAAPSLAEAVPLEAEELIFLEPMDGHLDGALRLMARTLGPLLSAEILSEASFPALAREAQRGARNGIDLRGGVGLFRLPDFDGAVGVVASSEPQLTQRLAREQLLAQGGRAVPTELGAARVRIDSTGTDAYFFTEGRFAYVLMRETFAAGDADDPRASAALALLRRPAKRSLGSSTRWRELQGRVRAAPIGFYRKLSETEGLLVHLREEGSSVFAAGFLRTDEPLRVGRPLASSNPLREQPESPVVVVSSWIAGTPVRRLLLGTRAVGARLRGLESVLASFGDRLTFLAYLGARADFSSAFGPNYLPYASFVLDAQVKDARKLQLLLGPDGEARELGELIAEEELELKFDGATARLRSPDAPRAKSPLLRRLRERFGNGAFGPQHFSLLIDFSALRAGLTDPIDLESLSDEEALALQQAAMLLLWQSDPYDFAFLDLEAVRGGLQLRGELRFSADPETQLGWLGPR
jgi:hypothetical protein